MVWRLSDVQKQTASGTRGRKADTRYQKRAADEATS